MQRKKIVIVGASSAIAEQCARLWAEDPAVDFVLVGRTLAKLELISADLCVRNPQSHITNWQVDFIDPVKIKAVVDAIVQTGKVDIVLIAQGSLPDQRQCQENLSLCSEALSINSISPVLFAEAFLGHMQKENSGTLAIIGSVAGDRGRKSNYIYGAAKSLLACYVQGISHRLAKTKVKVILVKPGPTDTPMTTHFKQQGLRLASAKTVACDILGAIKSGKSVIYTPARWFFIMKMVQYIPQFIFKKMDV